MAWYVDYRQTHSPSAIVVSRSGLVSSWGMSRWRQSTTSNSCKLSLPLSFPLSYCLLHSHTHLHARTHTYPNFLTHFHLSFFSSLWTHSSSTACESVHLLTLEKIQWRQSLAVHLDNLPVLENQEPIFFRSKLGTLTSRFIRETSAKYCWKQS